MTEYTIEQIMAEIRAQVKRQELSGSALAHALGVSRAYISRVLRGEQKPSDRVLEYFGFERVDCYRRLSKSRRARST